MGAEKKRNRRLKKKKKKIVQLRDQKRRLLRIRGGRECLQGEEGDKFRKGRNPR